jgi:predicted nucleotidyltransferase
MCARESGNQSEALPLFFDLNQTQDSVRISPLNALLDATLQFFISPDSNLIGIGGYVKEQFGKLLHHQSTMALTPAERDCLLSSIFHLYGSSVTGLQVSCVESDIDLMIEPPSTVRVPTRTTAAAASQSEDSDVEDKDESEEEEEKEEAEEDDEEEELDSVLNERRIRVSHIANREMKEILNYFISKEEKAIKNSKTQQRSDLFLEFLTRGKEIIQQYEVELKEQTESLKLSAMEASSKVGTIQATEQSTQQTTSEDLLPEVNLLKVVEKYLRKYGSMYGFTLKTYLHHIRVPLLSVRVSLPRTLPSSRDSELPSDDTLPPWISCDITLYKYHPLRNTAFICAYLNWDQTNKLKSLILLVKRFVQVHGIHGASHGYLSSYTWVMLVIHCLLRLEILPPIHLINKERPQPEMMSADVESMFGFTLESNPLLVTLSECSVSELFKFFLFYYTTQIDLITDVITLRSNGEVSSSHTPPTPP